jgi:hypothetical protein
MSETSAATAPISPRALAHLGVFLVLLLITVFTSGGPDRVGIRELKLPDFEKDQISAITLDGKHKAKLTKQGAGWTVEDPEKAGKTFPVEDSLIDRALDAIAELETGAFVTGRSEKHEELEINKDKGLALTVTGGKGKQMSIVIGRFAKGGGNYVRLDGSDEVFVGKGSLMGAVGKDAGGWRKKDILGVEEKDLVEVAVQVAGETAYSIVRGPPTGEGEESKPGEWKLADGIELPSGFRLDDAAITRIPRSLAGLRAVDFIDEAVSDTGLDAGATQVSARTADGKGFTVSFGKEDDKKRIYTQVSGDPQLYVVNNYSLKNVAKPLLELRDLALLPGLEADKVTKLSIAGAEGAVVVEKKDGAWSLTKGTAPADKPFDAATVDSKIGQLARLKATTYLGQGAAIPAAKPNTVITLVVDGESAPRTITFGGDLPAEGDQPANNVGVKVSDGHAYGISKYQRDRWGKPFDLFKKVAPPPGAGGGGGIPGMENLPPDIRKQLEAQLRSGKIPGAN